LDFLAICLFTFNVVVTNSVTLIQIFF
jgi:hypothetical protein